MDTVGCCFLCSFEVVKSIGEVSISRFLTRISSQSAFNCDTSSPAFHIIGIPKFSAADFAMIFSIEMCLFSEKVYGVFLITSVMNVKNASVGMVMWSLERLPFSFVLIPSAAVPFPAPFPSNLL